jgi:nucleoside-diphosphate-sugar epimerase
MGGILVTGADGFIGSRLVRCLLAEGHDVVRHSIGDGDIGACGLDFSGLDRVIHLAALTYVPDSWANPCEFYRVNTLGTARVLELCRSNRCGITFMSTYVYGSPKYAPIDEEHPVAPNSPYNHSKVLGESLCRFYHDAFGVPATVFRPFNIYGPGQARHFLIPEIFGQLLDEGRPEVVLKDLSPQRDYVYVDDVVRALALSVEKPAPYAVYNLGSGAATGVADLAGLCRKVSGIRKEIRSAGQIRPNEVTGIAADIRKAGKELGWFPEYSLEQGLKTMLRVLLDEKAR